VVSFKGTITNVEI